MGGQSSRDDGGPGLVELIARLSKTISRRSTDELLGMRLKEFLILSYLRDHAGATQQELGEAMFVEANAVVLLLNDLESRGLSVRRRDAEDRRRHVVEITAAGRDALTRASKAREAIEDDVLGGLSREDRELLRRLLLKALAAQPRIAAETA